ncbi:zinc finger CCCH domain-containing protein 18-like [Salvia miltiorrhiza]|uniref:zinc finger CCCH domain-containing protein 18-like n=1 Tax=Salvia miltiorrhiza TaxID=226208 RepID=UPI0025ACC2E4|nr:zinc finger CCCH domain-containing protein 18-like [Salvia miltiorrhiza]
MDSSEATKVVIERISRLEPEHVAKKIIGYMYFQGLSDQEMIRLALGPDSLIHNLIQKAKTARLLAPSQVISPPISPTMNPPSLSDPSFQFAPFQSVSPRPFPSPTAFRRMDPYWDAQLPVEQPTMQNAPLKLMPYSDYIGFEDTLDVGKPGASSFPNDYYCPEAALNSLSTRGARSSSNLMAFPVKTCHYFIKGFCKHGNNCRYYHGESFPETLPHAFGLSSYDVAGDEGFLPGSLEKLELEITELLKSRRGHPVSIASLPMLYYEKYGKTLQAEGYLTESQRHGKAGYSLTKLLARLKNSIRLIDRPHGQHAVILAEDAAKYMDIRAERNDPGPIVSGSRQIYMTFPAESTFTEEDVANYFSNFGPVQDVRMPCQQQRMFGFVTFVSADTVKLILSKGNPHYVCGARVLVKPYREKAKLVERRYLENFDHQVFFQSHPTDIDSELQTGWDSSRLFPWQLMEEQEHTIEVEAMRLAQLQLAGRPITSQSIFGYSMDELKVPEGHPKFPSREQFNYLLGVLNSGSTSDDNPKYPVNNCGDQESAQGVSLPDSPFASAVASSISAVI